MKSTLRAQSHGWIRESLISVASKATCDVCRPNKGQKSKGATDRCSRVACFMPKPGTWSTPHSSSETFTPKQAQELQNLRERAELIEHPAQLGGLPAPRVCQVHLASEISDGGPLLPGPPLQGNWQGLLEHEVNVLSAELCTHQLVEEQPWLRTI